MKSWPVMPNVPAAGHVTASGYWHPGDPARCRRCDDGDGHRLCRLSGAVAMFEEPAATEEGRVRLRVEPFAEFACRECGMPLRADARGRAPRHTSRPHFK